MLARRTARAAPGAAGSGSRHDEGPGGPSDAGGRPATDALRATSPDSGEHSLPAPGRLRLPASRACVGSRLQAWVEGFTGPMRRHCPWPAECDRRERIVKHTRSDMGKRDGTPGLRRMAATELTRTDRRYLDTWSRYPMIEGPWEKGLDASARRGGLHGSCSTSAVTALAWPPPSRARGVVYTTSGASVRRANASSPPWTA
jgi:hypothetical protein